jgi:very-short-patch-repair endonuclease
MAESYVAVSPATTTRSEHMEQMLRLAGSDLEIAWLRYLDERGCRLPSKAQELFEACGTRPDFSYSEYHAVVYIDGPHHQYPERKARDAAQTERMEDLGFTVIRFGHLDDWGEVLARYPHVFGRIS